MSALITEFKEEPLLKTIAKVIGSTIGALTTIGGVIGLIESKSGKTFFGWFTTSEAILGSCLAVALSVIVILGLRLRRAKECTKDANNLYKSDFESRSRICILIPDFESRNEDIKSDVLLILNGVGRAFSTLSKSIHSVLNIDLRYYPNRHKKTAGMIDTESEMLRIVRSELQIGTRYFICTTTEACKELSRHFQTLINKAEVGHAVLVCTLASGDDVVTVKNKIYRFFPRAHAEGAALAKEVKAQLRGRCEAANTISATAFSVKTEYGNALTEGFKTGWEGCWVTETPLNNNKHTSFVSAIKNNISTWAHCHVIFLAGTKKAILAILEATKHPALAAALKGHLLVVPSAFDPDDTLDPEIGESLSAHWKKAPIVCCRPRLNNWGEKVNGSIVEFYMANSLLKLVDTITALKDKGQSIERFDEQWTKAIRPGESLYDELFWKEPDPVIPMAVLESDLAKAVIAEWASAKKAP